MKDKQGFYRLSVAEVQRLNEDVAIIYFNLTADLTDAFRYQAGQFLTFRFEIEGQEVRRSYSICTAPADQRFGIAVKRVKDGLVSNWMLDHVRPGQAYHALPPAGKFVAEKGNEATQLALFAAGIGITPLISIIKDNLGRTQEPIILVYSSTHPEQTPFRLELETMAAAHPDRLKLTFHYTRPEGKANAAFRINRIQLADLFDFKTNSQARREAYVCGPEGFMREVVAVLKNRIPYKQIHTEKFASIRTVAAAGNDEEIAATPCQLTATLDGEKRVIMMTDQEYILNRVAMSGLEPPHNCMSGICGVCMAKLEKGKIIMDEDYALTDEDKQNQLILTCQARPQTEEVEVRFV